MRREQVVAFGSVAMMLTVVVWLGAGPGHDDDLGGITFPDPAARTCEPASDALVAAIEAGLAGEHLVGARIVRSDDIEHRYAVAGTVDGTLAVFVADDRDGGAIRALDERTAAVSGFPLDTTAGPDDAFRAVLSCRT